MERREFMRIGAAFPWAAAAMVAGTKPAPFAGRLSRIAFLDDVASVAAVSPAVPAQVARAILTQRGLFLAGGAMPADGTKGEQAAALAAARAALECWRPLEPAGEKAGLARDARLLRELAARGGQAGANVSAKDMAGLFDTMSRRTLIAIHTYIPDDRDVEGWMERLILLHEAARGYWSGLAAAYVSARHGADGFYDASEGMIRVAGAVDFGPVDPGAVRKALAEQPKSEYAKALAEAHRALCRA